MMILMIIIMMKMMIIIIIIIINNKWQFMLNPVFVCVSVMGRHARVVCGSLQGEREERGDHVRTLRPGDTTRNRN